MQIAVTVHGQVASPMAGMMYRSPAPGEPPFVKDGDKVTKGQTICIIEAMKLMNEIEARNSRAPACLCTSCMLQAPLLNTSPLT
jgi:acetyl/propionyl-CoA carboxylase alpha subunit